jgi:hypothetical protein
MTLAEIRADLRTRIAGWMHAFAYRLDPKSVQTAIKMARKIYREEFRDRINQQKLASYHRNREKNLAYQRRYCERNRAMLAQRARAYRARKKAEREGLL